MNITVLIKEKQHTVYDRIDAAATINFSVQFGAATIRERRLFVRRGYRLQKFSEKVNTSTRMCISAPSHLRKWRPRSLPSPFGCTCKHRWLGSTYTVRRNQP